MGTAVRKVILALLALVLVLVLLVFVFGRNDAARRFQTAVGLKGYMNSIEEPESTGVTIALMVPWMWCRGSRCNNLSLGVYFHAWIRDSACAVSADWGIKTPFWYRQSLSPTQLPPNKERNHTGRFVVPDV